MSQILNFLYFSSFYKTYFSNIINETYQHRTEIIFFIEKTDNAMKKITYISIVAILLISSISFARVQYSNELEVDGEELAIGNFLNWSTSFEENSDVFFVEKSMDNGQNFEVIGQVSAAGNTLKGKEYRFLDLNVTDGTVWYRLRQVDKDKTESFSNVAEIEKLVANNLVIKDINTIEVKKEFVVQLESFKNGTLEYVLTDGHGTIVMEMVKI